MIDPAEAARKKRRHRNERIAAAVLVLVVAGLTAGAVLFERRAREADREDAQYVPKPEVITPEIELLRDYVRIDTTTPQGAAAGARWLAEQLGQRGVAAEIIESTPGHLNVYARIRGLRPGGALLLFNHIDVVPPGDGWSQPPFEGKIVFNELYGRGSLDMKSLAVCQLVAMGNLARSGRPPVHDIVFLATAEEERGSTNGMGWLLEHRPDLFEGVESAMTEGGLAETMSDRISYFGVEIGGKQLVQVRLDAASAEPLRQARFRLQRYVRFRHPHRVLPGVRQYFADVAPTRTSLGPYLAEIDRTIARGQFWRLPDTYSEFTQNTLRVMAPYRDGARWSMRVAMLNLPDADPDERIAWLRREVAPLGVTIGAILSKGGPVPLSRTDTRLFRILRDQAKQQYTVHAGTQILYNAMTDCRLLRVRGIPCYGVSPYPVNIFQARSIHRSDERIRLDWFRQGVVYVDQVVARWASGQ